ncbi:MAG TPA: hypothetical protein PLA68_07715, partial [Panacibacter sp.]|nr:hypothetical protein [Panacibacter sp.]
AISRHPCGPIDQACGRADLPLSNSEPLSSAPPIAISFPLGMLMPVISGSYKNKGIEGFVFKRKNIQKD